MNAFMVFTGIGLVGIGSLLIRGRIVAPGLAAFLLMAGGQALLWPVFPLVPFWASLIEPLLPTAPAGPFMDTIGRLWSVLTYVLAVVVMVCLPSSLVGGWLRRVQRRQRREGVAS